MEKILIVNTNLQIGGIQKALIGLLWELSKNNDVTLLLLFRDGKLQDQLPPTVKVLETKSDLKYMGMSKQDCTRRVDYIKKGFYTLVSRYANQKCAVWLASHTMRRDRLGCFDKAISFTHVGNSHEFYGGSAAYVLHSPNMGKRICYIHCDYLQAENRSPYSDEIYNAFDEIVCVSESTKHHFIQALPSLEYKVRYEYNYILADSIRRQAQTSPYMYDDRFMNLLSVARLTHEKGIARFVQLLSEIDFQTVRYYIVGSGPEEHTIAQIVSERNMESHVILLGETDNPYRYMMNADMLIVPSYHEAAPMVFQEAKLLMLPVFTTETTSAKEMVTGDDCCVVANEDDAIRAKLKELVQRRCCTKDERSGAK